MIDREYITLTAGAAIGAIIGVVIGITLLPLHGATGGFGAVVGLVIAEGLILCRKDQP